MELKEFIDILVWINEKKHFQRKIKISLQEEYKIVKIFLKRISFSNRYHNPFQNRRLEEVYFNGPGHWMAFEIPENGTTYFFFSYGNTHVVKRRWPQHSILTSADIATGQWAREWEKCESRKEIVKLFEIKWQYFRDRGERKKKLDKLKN